MNLEQKECQGCLERFLDENNTPADIEHMNNCEYCLNARKVLAAGTHLNIVAPVENNQLIKKIAQKAIARRLQSSQKPALRWLYNLLTMKPAFALAVVLLMISLTVAYWAGSRDSTKAPRQKISRSVFSLRESPEKLLLMSFGSRVTVGQNRSSSVEYDERIKLEISGGSNLIINKNDINLQSGSVFVSVRPGSGAFAVLTRHGSVSVIGTQFSCSVTNAATQVSVTKGVVELTSQDGRKKRLNAGESGQITDSDPQNGNRNPVSTEF